MIESPLLTPQAAAAVTSAAGLSLRGPIVPRKHAELPKYVRAMIRRGADQHINFVRVIARNESVKSGVYVPQPHIPEGTVGEGILFDRQDQKKGRLWVTRVGTRAILDGKERLYVDEVVFVDLDQARN